MPPTDTADRLYLCPSCSSAQPAPVAGGSVTCAGCQTVTTLPDRSAGGPAAGRVPVASSDPARIAHLRSQDGRPRQVSQTLQTALGGQSIQPGREQEALAIWQSLRARSAAGDVAASEDLSLLTLILAQHPWTIQQPALSQALSESALDAVVLPRHRQEQRGRLCRLAASKGKRALAQTHLAAMIADAPELETDSEHRLAAAVVATLDRNGPRVIELLGAQKDAIPIADSMDALASVLRANAYELQGDLAAAATVLRELPDPQILPIVQSRFPALPLCTASAAAYGATTTRESAERAAAGAGAFGMMAAGGVMFVGLVVAGGGAVVGLFTDETLEGVLAPLVIGVVLIAISVVLIVRARAKGKRAAWLRTHGLSLTARIVNATPTGTEINDVPLYELHLQVSGPQGPYTGSFKKLAREHEIALLLGREIRVRANPNDLQDLMLEE